MKNHSCCDFKDIVNLKDLISHTEQLWKERELFRIPEQNDSYSSISYEVFSSDINALGTSLCSLSLAGKRIAIVGKNCYGWVLTYFATANSGGCAVPIDPELDNDAICDIVARTHAEALFYSNSSTQTAQAVLFACHEVRHAICLDNLHDEDTDRNVFDLVRDGHTLLNQGNEDFVSIHVDDNAPAVILFTSGTTGTRKGVVLSHRNIASNVTAGVHMVLLSENSVCLSVLPYHHTYECTCGLMIVMCWGACICFNDSIKNIAKNLKRFSPTVLFLVPLYVESFYKKIMDNVKKTGSERKLKFAIFVSSLLLVFGIDLRQKLFAEVLAALGGKLKTIVCGGAYLRPDYVKSFWQFGVQILQGYGITECAPLVAVNREKFWRYDSVGLPIPCNEVKIAGSESEGEILIKGANVMQGYYDAPEKTAESFEDGWYKSGDIGYMDSKGFLYVTGRKANVIVLKNGKNIAPEELESALSNNDLIKEVVIVGQKDEAGVYGLFAYIRLEDEFDKSTDQIGVYNEVKSVIDALNLRNPSHKYISDFALVQSDFPKTTSQKIMRYKINDKGKDDNVRES